VPEVDTLLLFLTLKSPLLEAHSQFAILLHMQAHELYVTFSIPFDQFKDLSYEQASHIIDNFRDKGISSPRKLRYTLHAL
jgi:hypothetical protein